MKSFMTLCLLLVFLIPESFGQSKSKNIVLMLADDLGFELGCYGDKVAKTPHIDELAKQGVRFTSAFASVASCSPSRATLLTGLPTHQNGQYGLAHATHNAHSFRTVASISKLLQKAGYVTGQVSKLHVQPESVYPWDYVGEKVNGRNPLAIAAMVKEMIDKAGEKPFFLLVGFTDPHRAGKGFANDAKLPPAAKTDPFDPKSLTLPYFLPNQPEVRNEYAEYYRAVQRLDMGVGLVMQTLKETKKLDETLVLFLSDNGIPFPGAKTTLYDSGIHLPLIVRSPQQSKRGLVNQAMVSFTDVAPTILDYAGVKPDAAMLGRSFLPILEQEKPKDWDTVYASHQFHEITMYYPMRMIRTRTHKLIHNLAYPLRYPFASDLHDSQMWQGILKRNDTMMGERPRKNFEHRPEWELYDLTQDPKELNNLAQKPEQAELLKELQGKLKQWRTETKDPWLIKEIHE